MFDLFLANSDFVQNNRYSIYYIIIQYSVASNLSLMMVHLWIMNTFPVGFVATPSMLRLCIALCAVAEGWLLLDIGRFVLFLSIKRERCIPLNLGEVNSHCSRSGWM